MIILYILGSISMVYFLVLSIFTGFSNLFHFFWLLLGILFLSCGMWVSYCHVHEKEIPGALLLTARVILIVTLLIFAAGESLVLSGFFEHGKPELPYVIVLGAKVNGESPSRALAYRIQSAGDYLRENPGTTAILSGGQGRDEKISEAECMYRELIKAGISENRLIREDQSTNTKENILFSRQLISERNIPIGIVTNNFHVYRSVLTAKKLGFSDVYGISAKTTYWILPDQMVRELFSLFKFYLYGV